MLYNPLREVFSTIILIYLYLFTLCFSQYLIHISSNTLTALHYYVPICAVLILVLSFNTPTAFTFLEPCTPFDNSLHALTVFTRQLYKAVAHLKSPILT